MKTKHWVMIVVFCVVASVIFWLWRSGIIPGWTALIGAILSLFGAGNTAQKDHLERKKRELDQIIKDMSRKDKEIEQLRKRHDKEVRQVEENDYGDISTDELIAGANERERKRRSDQAD
jgi:biopolymer transport protein ExbB/TolQ